MAMGTKTFRRIAVLLLSVWVLSALTLLPPGRAAATGSPVFNASFEEPVTGSQIPGWSEFIAPGSVKVSYGVTNEKARTGSYSLKLTDMDDGKGVAIWSQPIPIIAGETYTGSVWIYIEGSTFNNGSGSVPNRASFVMRFYDENGTQVGGDNGVVHHSAGQSQWVKLQTGALTAPANAKTVRVMASVSNLWQTNGAYYDDFHIDGVFPTEDIPAVQSLALAGPASVPINGTYEVVLSARGASGLYAVNASMYFDPQQFQFVSAEGAGPFASEGQALFRSQQTQSGKVQIVATQLGNHAVTGDVQVATLRFKPLQKTDAAVIRLDRGATTAKIDADETGKLYTLGTDVELSVGIRDRLEDVTGDGKVNLADLVAAARKVGTAVSPDTAKFDLNADGKIDIADLSLISLALFEGGAP